MKRRQFEKLALQALEELPPEVHGWLDNVDIVVEDWPTPEELAEAGMEGPYDLLGLYSGVPRTERLGYDPALPDKVTLYQGPIEAMCRTREEIRREVRATILHEIGHHLGLDDARLEELGWA